MVPINRENFPLGIDANSFLVVRCDAKRYFLLEDSKIESWLQEQVEDVFKELKEDADAHE